MTAGRVIETDGGEVENFQLVAIGGMPNAVWLHVSGVLGVYLSNLVFEALPGSGPFRLEYHKGRVQPAAIATPDVMSLALATYGEYGYWDATAGYSGMGYEVPGAQISSEDDEDDMAYASVLIYPLRGNRTVGAGIRVHVEEVPPL